MKSYKHPGNLVGLGINFALLYVILRNVDDVELLMNWFLWLSILTFIILTIWQLVRNFWPIKLLSAGSTALIFAIFIYYSTLNIKLLQTTLILAGVIVIVLFFSSKARFFFDILHILLALGIFLAPPTIWPILHSMQLLIAFGCLSSVLLIASSLFNYTNHQSSTRFVIYTIWFVIGGYLALSYAIEQRYFLSWTVAIVWPILCTTLFIKFEQVVLPALSNHRRRWELRKEFLFRQHIVVEPDLYAHMIDVKDHVDELIFLTQQSLKLEYSIRNILSKYMKEHLATNPAIQVISREILLDLPSEFPRIIRDQIDLILSAELGIQNHQKQDGKFDNYFIANQWRSFINRRLNVLKELGKTGELHSLLDVRPEQPIRFPYSSTGLLLDYNELPSEYLSRWESELAYRLSPEELYKDNPKIGEEINEFLGWLNKIKPLRNRLVSGMTLRSTYSAHINSVLGLGKKGFSEYLAYIDRLISSELYFGAVDLANAAEGIAQNSTWRSSFKMQAVRAEYQYLYKFSRAKSPHSPTITRRNLDSNYIRFENNTRSIINVNGTDLSVWLKSGDDYYERFDLPAGRERVSKVPSDPLDLILLSRFGSLQPTRISLGIKKEFSGLTELDLLSLN